MRSRSLTLLLVLLNLSGCAALDHLFCAPDCHSESHNSSSLVNFLYPDGKMPPREDVVPELHLPLRIGLAFLPSQNVAVDTGLEAARKEELLQRIRQRFADRKFITDIVIIPDYYLANKRGFAGLDGVQRLYNIDLMALVSYDQSTHSQDNDWSLSYLTILGAYVVKGTRHDISTLVDLAVIDPVTRSLVLRAGGVDTRHGNSTHIDQRRETREASAEGFSAATNQLITNFDSALSKFETDVREGKANVKVVHRESSSHGGGGGALTPFWIAIFGMIGVVSTVRKYKSTSPESTLT